MTSRSLHVRAEGIIEDRKKILESAMQSAFLLKNIQLVRALSRQKKSQITAFKRNLKEISHLISEFSLEEVQEPKTKKQTVRKTKKMKVEIPKEKSRIEKDLEDIQSKLESLKF